MAHNLDESTGRPAMAYVGKTPWHGLGEKLPQGKPIEVWLDAARLRWHIERLPVQYLAKGTLQTMEDRFVLVRSDTDAPLSVVSGDYRVVQPGQILEFYRELVEFYGYTLETAGALDEGRKVWALARTGRHGFTDESTRDEIAAYVLLATSYDKTLATTAAFTSIRVVCQNTLFFAVEDIAENRRPQVKVPHNLRFDPVRVKTQLGIVDQAWQSFMAKVQKMARYTMDPDQASDFFRRVLLQKDTEKLTSKAESEHHAIVSLLERAPGQDLDSAHNTLWGAVNAVTYYVDHVRSAGAVDRVDNAWFGSGNVLKEKVWSKAVALIS